VRKSADNENKCRGVHDQSDANETLCTQESEFLTSLDNLTGDDLAPKEKAPDKTKKILLSALRILVMLISGTVFIGGIIAVIITYTSYQKGEEIYENLAQDMFNTQLGGERAVALSKQLTRMTPMLDYNTGLTADENESEPVEIIENSERFEIMRSNLYVLKNKNPDVYGFINVEGTKIKYPIVKGKDNEFYLDHAWNKEYVVVGSIFADHKANNEITKNRNTVLYGHNMNDGSMFHAVMDFLDPEVFESKLVEIYTLDGIYIYKPFSVFQTYKDEYYYRMEYSDDADFAEFCRIAKVKSAVQNDIEVGAPDDTIITLSTCTETDDYATAMLGGRYVLHAKLIRVEH